jgi:hypothetical protein
MKTKQKATKVKIGLVPSHHLPLLKKKRGQGKEKQITSDNHLVLLLPFPSFHISSKLKTSRKTNKQNTLSRFKDWKSKAFLFQTIIFLRDSLSLSSVLCIQTIQNEKTKKKALSLKSSNFKLFTSKTVVGNQLQFLESLYASKSFLSDFQCLIFFFSIGQILLLLCSSKNYIIWSPS